jgi:hypothetical protein
MPSNQEFFDAIKNISVDADTLNLNTDQVESKLDTTTGLLTTLSADTALIKADMANGVSISGSINVGATASAVSAFTSVTSAVIGAANANRKLLAIFNEGAGFLYIVYGASAASVTNYSVRLNAGEYLEIDRYSGEVRAIFGSAGTARVTEVT